MGPGLFQGCRKHFHVRIWNISLNLSSRETLTLKLKDKLPWNSAWSLFVILLNHLHLFYCSLFQYLFCIKRNHKKQFGLYIVPFVIDSLLVKLFFLWLALTLGFQSWLALFATIMFLYISRQKQVILDCAVFMCRPLANAGLFRANTACGDLYIGPLQYRSTST